MFSNMSIQKIEEYVRSASLTKELLEQLRKDERKGVQRLLARIEKEQEEQKKLIEQYERMSFFETALKKEGKKFIAGIDEVGRGSLAGPVVAAAVILPDEPILGLYDSKQVNKKKRMELFERIHEKAIVGIGTASPHEIDRHNIYIATKMAMVKAIKACSATIDHVLIDAMQLPISISQTSIIEGDRKSVSIAAASIIAKVTRDRMMAELAQSFPQYGFDRNVGYGTKEHLHALKNYGATKEHRLSFSPVAETMKG